MSTTALFGALELGLILGFVAIAVFISFRVLNFPDLTVEGTFPLGGAVAAMMIAGKHASPEAATICAALAGALAGAATGLLNTRLKIIQILSGILVMTALYSVNLRVMGRPNVALLGEDTIFTHVGNLTGLSDRYAGLLALVALAVILATLFGAFMSSRIGLALRASGANARMARANGVKDTRMIVMGLALSNAFAAFAGALFAQHAGAADATMGFGIIVIGLASLIVGEGIFPSRKVFIAVVSCIVGSLLYRLAVSLALNTDFLGLQSQDLSLVTAVLVTVAVVVSRARHTRAELAAIKKNAVATTLGSAK